MTESNFQPECSFQELKCSFWKTSTGQFAFAYFPILIQPFGTKPVTHLSVVAILILSNIFKKNSSLKF